MRDEATTPVSAALRALRPGADDDDAGHARAFAAIAELLLHRTTLHIAGQAYRLTELEFYWDGPGHRDPFTHGDPNQRVTGTWYFHRERGGAYKGGSFKGVDISVGDAETPAGVLIRGARGADGAVLDGSCVFVDHVLARTGSGSIAALAGRFDGSVDSPGGDSPVYLRLAPPGERARIVATPRVGLTLKKGATPERQRFIARGYRFLCEPRAIKKGKPHIVVGLHREGLAADEIAAESGVSRTHVDRYLAAYRAGAQRDPASFPGDPGPLELCGLFGACDRLWPAV